MFIIVLIGDADLSIDVGVSEDLFDDRERPFLAFSVNFEREVRYIVGYALLSSKCINEGVVNEGILSSRYSKEGDSFGARRSAGIGGVFMIG